jgi:hypothetical protein
VCVCVCVGVCVSGRRLHRSRVRDYLLSIIYYLLSIIYYLLSIIYYLLLYYSITLLLLSIVYRTSGPPSGHFRVYKPLFFNFIGSETAQRIEIPLIIEIPYMGISSLPLESISIRFSFPAYATKTAFYIRVGYQGVILSPGLSSGLSGFIWRVLFFSEQ